MYVYIYTGLKGRLDVDVDVLSQCHYICILTPPHTHTQRERERERERDHVISQQEFTKLCHIHLLCFSTQRQLLECDRNVCSYESFDKQIKKIYNAMVDLMHKNVLENFILFKRYVYLRTKNPGIKKTCRQSPLDLGINE